MAAPSGTQWGSVFGSGSGQGRIGLYITASSTQTQTTVTMQIWFWSKYSIYDSSNTFHYSFTGIGVIDIGSRNINHPSESAWSTSNQTHIGTYSRTYDRGTSATNISCAADFSGIEVISGGGWVDKAYTIPARNRYSITYNANGGTGAPATQYYYYGYDTKLSTQIPTRTGYRFLGWSLSSTATSPSYSAGQSWSGYNAANYTLYAVWERIVLTVTFDAGYNGGTVQDADEVGLTYFYGDRMGELPVAEKRNYKFLGWNTQADGNGTMVSENTVVNVSIRLYAIFELQANCYVRVNGTYKTGMMYKKVNGTYKTGVVSVRANGTYKETNM